MCLIIFFIFQTKTIFAHLPKGVRCLSGRKERFAKSSYGLNCTVGSNPTLSAKKQKGWVKLFRRGGSKSTLKAKKVLINPKYLSSGCSVARLSRLVWDQEVASSNLAIPTKAFLINFKEAFFMFVT